MARQKPSNIQIGDKVYFVDRGVIYLYATYAGYDYRKSVNVQGITQSGEAFLLKAPVKRINPPLPLGPAILGGPWPWRYDNWNLGKLI